MLKDSAKAGVRNRDQLMVTVRTGVLDLKSSMLRMDLAGVTQILGLMLDEFHGELIRAAPEVQGLREEIFFAMPMVTQQDPGLLTTLQNDLPGPVPRRFHTGLLFFPSRRSGVEAIFALLVDQQSPVPFHGEPLGAS